MRVVAMVHDARAGGVARRHGGLRRLVSSRLELWQAGVGAICCDDEAGGRVAGRDGHVTGGGVATGCVPGHSHSCIALVRHATRWLVVVLRRSASDGRDWP